jgi:hypothetical protein
MADIGDTSHQPPQFPQGNAPHRTEEVTAAELDIIKHFVQGKKRALSTATLKLEYSDKAVRLTDVQGRLLGISNQINEWQQKILLSHKSKYTTAIQQILLDRGFVASQKSLHPDFDEYHHYQLPKGYKLNYTEALQLWKVWWNSKRYQLNSPTLQVDVLVFNKNNWYPIQDLRPNQGNFVLKTPIGEMMIPATDRVVWVDRGEVTDAKTPSSQESQPPTTPPPPPPPKQIVIQIVQSPQPGNVPNSTMTTEILPVEPEVTKTPEPPIGDEPDRIADIDLEEYLNTFDTDDSEDVDRIEGIFNIDELLSEQLLTEDSTIEDLFTPSTPTAPVVVAQSGQITSEVVPATPPTPTDSIPINPSAPMLSPSERKQALKIKALQVLTHYLQQGEEINTQETIKTPQGEILQGKNITIKRGCPPWAIQQAQAMG